MISLTIISTVFAILNCNAYNVNAATCYDPTNTLAASRPSGETNYASGPTGGIVTCTAAGSCGLILSSGAGVCQLNTFISSTSTILYLGGTTTATTFATLPTANAVKSCYASYNTLVACSGLETAPAVTVLGCYTTKAGVGSCITSGSLATVTTAASFTTTATGYYCFTTNCNAPWIYTFSGENKMQFNFVALVLSALVSVYIF